MPEQKQELAEQKKGVSIKLQKVEQELGDTRTVSVEIKAESKMDVMKIYDKIKDSFIPKKERG